MLAVVLCLGAAILVLAASLWQRPRVDGAIACAFLSALWWPANNKVLEGPVLLSFTSTHGLTTADLLGFFGMYTAIMAIRRAPRTPVTRREAAAAVGFIALVGGMTAYITG